MEQIVTLLWLFAASRNTILPSQYLKKAYVQKQKENTLQTVNRNIIELELLHYLSSAVPSLSYHIPNSFVIQKIPRIKYKIVTARTQNSFDFLKECSISGTKRRLCCMISSLRVRIRKHFSVTVMFGL